MNVKGLGKWRYLILPLTSLKFLDPRWPRQGGFNRMGFFNVFNPKL